MAQIVGLVFPEEGKKSSADSGKATARKGKKKPEKGKEEK